MEGLLSFVDRAVPAELVVSAGVVPQIAAVLKETKIKPDQLGKDFLYSNFGYCLLGRVIEHVTGMSYIQYLRKTFKVDVLIANGQADKLLPNETYYYSKD